MPKEITYSSDEPFVMLDEHGEVAASQAPPGKGAAVLRRAVEVRWNRDGFVEIGAAVYDAGTGALHSPFSGCFLTLDRQGVNRTIRALRKARDQGLGRDE